MLLYFLHQYSQWSETAQQIQEDLNTGYGNSKPINHLITYQNQTEPPHDKTNKMACAPSEDSDQPGHPPSLIRVFAVHMKKAWFFSYPLSTQQRLWSDRADAQADLSLRWDTVILLVLSWDGSDSSMLANWMSPFFILRGVWCIFVVFIEFLIEIPVCKLCRPWSDAVFCSIWSGSRLFT